MNTILKYFPDLTGDQVNRLSKLKELYNYWNKRINVISRKDIEYIYVHHVLHSLSIAKIIYFKKGTRVLDVGTGGGFPGIPLAILFPETTFFLIDSIGKKIKVVDSVVSKLGLTNVFTKQIRVENFSEQFDFIVSRAVTAFPNFIKLVKDKISPTSKNSLPNGIIYLKGGDIQDDINIFDQQIEVFNIKDFFKEDFFETKKIIYYKLKA